jgi:cytochrome c biogenesis protein CcdA
MFIVPLLLVFLFALLGATAQDFSGLFKRHLGMVKILMAVMFFALGIFLVWKG